MVAGALQHAASGKRVGFAAAQPGDCLGTLQGSLARKGMHFAARNHGGVRAMCLRWPVPSLVALHVNRSMRNLLPGLAARLCTPPVLALRVAD